MAILVCYVSYPTEQNDEMLKRLQEMSEKIPIPDYVTVRGPYFDSDSEKGIQGFMIFEVEAAKLNEQRTRMSAGCHACHGVPGFKWSIRQWSERSDVQERREKYGF